MSEKLKPCPFCGSEAFLINEGKFWAADCENIDCIIRRTRYYITEQEAVEAWNRRVGE